MSPTSYRAAPPRDAVAFARHPCEKSFLAKSPLPVNKKIIFWQIFFIAVLRGLVCKKLHLYEIACVPVQDRACAASLRIQSGSRQSNRAAAAR